MYTREDLIEQLMAKAEEDTGFRGRLLANPGSAPEGGFQCRRSRRLQCGSPRGRCPHRAFGATSARRAD